VKKKLPWFKLRSPRSLEIVAMLDNGADGIVFEKEIYMKDLAIKAVVTGPNGFYYREEHEWRGLNQEASDKMTAHQKKIADYIAKASSNAETDGLVADLTGMMDGAQMAPVHVEGISYGELNKFQRMWAQLEQEWLDAGSKHGQKKDQERHQHGSKHKNHP
jgi:hypothetical protein